MDLVASTVLWIIIIGGLSFHFRKKLSALLLRLPLPKPMLFLVVGLSYSWVEESINCPPTGCTLLPHTLAFFLLFLVLLLAFIRVLGVRNYHLSVIFFGLLGWVVEFLLGYHQSILWSDPVITAIMTPWVFLTYSVIVVVPVTILLEGERPRENGF